MNESVDVEKSFVHVGKGLYGFLRVCTGLRWESWTNVVDSWAMAVRSLRCNL